MSSNTLSDSIVPRDGESDSAFKERALDEASRKLKLVCDRVEEQVYGQRDAIETSLVTLLAGGSLLLEGPPGTGKTEMIKCLAQALGLDTSRVQGTPDLMPSDITGSEMFDKQNEGELKFVKGPIFAQIMHLDEINRASPKTQSGSLQSMQENKVTASGKDYLLPRPFLLVSTQNPRDQEGTYPLPEALLDRFMIKLHIGSVDKESERRILMERTSGDMQKTRELYNKSAEGIDLTVREKAEDKVLEAVLKGDDLIKFHSLSLNLPLNDELAEAILNLVRNTRPNENEEIKDVFAQGAEGARPLIAIGRLIKARATLNHKKAPDLEDVKAIAPYVLSHRVKAAMSVGNEKDATIKKTIDSLINKI